MAFIAGILAAIRKTFPGFSQVDKGFKTFDTRHTFNKIYRLKIWGRHADGKASSGSGSHDTHVVGPYVVAIKALLASYSTPPKMVDLGCGDFNVGQQFSGDVSALIACDISDIVLAQNAENTPPENTQFVQLDLAKGPLPHGDIACVRQVLQHLSNDEICGFISALHRQTPYKALVVTEHISASAAYTPNIDKFSGPSTRVQMKSGVDLALPPFSLAFSKQEILLEIPEPCEGQDAVLRTTLYTLA